MSGKEQREGVEGEGRIEEEQMKRRGDLITREEERGQERGKEENEEEKRREEETQEKEVNKEER